MKAGKTEKAPRTPGRFGSGWGHARNEIAAILALPDLGRYWVGQLVSDVGSQATLFVLMTSVYIETGSLTQFALLFALDNVPDIALSPLAGVLVDRCDRRLLHVIGDTGVALVTTAALVLWSVDSLSVPIIYALVIIGSVFQVVQGAAAEAMYQELVPPAKLVRTSAVLGPADEIVEVVAPALGITIVAIANAGFVFVLDLLTFAVALWTLFTLRHPERFRIHIGSDGSDDAGENDEDDTGTLRYLCEGVRFLRHDAGMRFIFVYSLFDDFLSSLVLLMAAAAALELGGEAMLASVQGAAGAGAVLGMLLIALFGLRRGRVLARNVMVPGLIIGLLLLAVPLSATASILTVAAFAMMLLSAPLDATLHATSLAAIPKRLIGRTSAFFDVSGGLANLVLLLAVAPAVEHLLGPAIADDWLAGGALAGLGGASAELAPLLLMIGLAGLGMLVLNTWALGSRLRAAGERLAEAIECAPVFAPSSPVAPGDPMNQGNRP